MWRWIASISLKGFFKDKQMKKQEKIDLFIQDVINKMFEIAGYNLCYEDVENREDAWFIRYEMTLEQNLEWKEWGVSEIRKRFRHTIKQAEREMGMINLQWGLKLSEIKKQ